MLEPTMTPPLSQSKPFTDGGDSNGYRVRFWKMEWGRNYGICSPYTTFISGKDVILMLSGRG